MNPITSKERIKVKAMYRALNVDSSVLTDLSQRISRDQPSQDEVNAYVERGSFGNEKIIKNGVELLCSPAGEVSDRISLPKRPTGSSIKKRFTPKVPFKEEKENAVPTESEADDGVVAEGSQRRSELSCEQKKQASISASPKTPGSQKKRTPRSSKREGSSPLKNQTFIKSPFGEVNFGEATVLAQNSRIQQILGPNANVIAFDSQEESKEKSGGLEDFSFIRSEHAEPPRPKGEISFHLSKGADQSALSSFHLDTNREEKTEGEQDQPSEERKCLESKRTPTRTPESQFLQNLIEEQLASTPMRGDLLNRQQDAKSPVIERINQELKNQRTRGGKASANLDISFGESSPIPSPLEPAQRQSGVQGGEGEGGGGEREDSGAARSSGADFKSAESKGLSSRASEEKDERQSPSQAWSDFVQEECELKPASEQSSFIPKQSRQQPEKADQDPSNINVTCCLFQSQTPSPHQVPERFAMSPANLSHVSQVRGAQGTAVEQQKRRPGQLPEASIEIASQTPSQPRASLDPRFIKMQDEISRNQRLVQELTEQLAKSSQEKENHVAKLMRRIAQLEESTENEDAQIRSLEDFILRQQGNIQVFCRVRPQDGSKASIVQVPRQNLQQTRKMQAVRLDFRGHNSMFTFNQVFGAEQSQKSIFEEVQPFVKAAFDGDNVCLFAYGQTGSGKTYTMQGPDFEVGDSLPPATGILPRVAEFIASELEKIKIRTPNFKFEVKVSSIEVYCEQVRYLLGKPQKEKPTQLRPARPYSPTSKLSQQQAHLSSDKNTDDQRLLDTTSSLTFLKSFLSAIQESTKRRVVRDNGHHDNSSRSHHIFQIFISRTAAGGKETQSCLSVVDLAGSERRIKPSTASRDSMKKASARDSPKPSSGESIVEREQKFINLSLSTLGRVFSALSSRDSRAVPPYRECKLTRLLQSSLERGSCKVLMIVNIQQGEAHGQQTKESLEFASTAMISR